MRLNGYCGDTTITLGVGAPEELSELWENPQIPAVGRPGTGPRLVDGLVITIEPIAVTGKPDVYVADDGWTVRTTVGQPAAQFDHTILLTPHGAQVLTAA